MRVFVVDKEPTEGNWVKISGRYFVKIDGDVPKWLDGADEIQMPGEPQRCPYCKKEI